MLFIINALAVLIIFFNRVFKLGYTKECFSVLNILSEKHRQL